MNTTLLLGFAVICNALGLLCLGLTVRQLRLRITALENERDQLAGSLMTDPLSYIKEQASTDKMNYLPPIEIRKPRR